MIPMWSIPSDISLEMSCGEDTISTTCSRQDVRLVESISEHDHDHDTDDFERPEKLKELYTKKTVSFITRRMPRSFSTL